MKRYLLFWGPAYESSGGWRDLHGDFENIVDAIAEVPASCWYQIIDSQTMAVVVDDEKPDAFVERRKGERRKEKNCQTLDTSTSPG